jgi:hypothetical protein
MLSFVFHGLINLLGLGHSPFFEPRTQVPTSWARFKTKDPIQTVSKLIFGPVDWQTSVKLHSTAYFCAELVEQRLLMCLTSVGIDIFKTSHWWPCCRLCLWIRRDARFVTLLHSIFLSGNAVQFWIELRASNKLRVVSCTSRSFIIGQCP